MIYTKEEFNDINKSELTFIFDTNVLLDLYKYNDEMIDYFISIFDSNIDKFWIPKQVQVEFNRHFIENKIRNLSICSNIKEQVSRIVSDLNNSVDVAFNRDGKFRLRNSQIGKQDILNDIKKFKKDITNKLDEIQPKINKDLKEDEDCIHKFVNSIVNENPFTQLELMNIYEEGDKRFKYKIPPGFTDASKDNLEEKKERNNNEEKYSINKYGDLIVWKELLRKISNDNKKVIFIQNEKKEDWWDYVPRKKIAKALEEEFELECMNSKLYMMDFEEFLHHFALCLGMNKTKIEEIMEDIRKYKAIQKSNQHVIDYISNNSKNIIENYILCEKIEELNQSIADKIIGKSVIGGYIDYITDDIDIIINSIKDIDIEPVYDFEDYEFNLINEDGEYAINANCIISGKGCGYESFSKEYSENIVFELTAEIDIKAIFTIRLLEDMDIDEIGSNLNLTDYSIVCEITKLDGEYSFECDDYDEYYTICPDCRKYINHTNDGGNGFCKECASEH